MTENSFSTKWSKISKEDKKEVGADEKSLFVPIGCEPITQRQLNLYYYFLYIKKILKRTRAKRVLEVGCGRGTISLYLSKYLRLSTILLDNVPDAIEIAREDFEKHNQKAEFYIEDVLHTHFPNESFDAVVSIGLAEHFDTIDDLFKEQYRLLRDGGVMISLNIPKKFSIQFLNTIMRFFKKLYGAYKESIRKDYYRNTLKPKDFKKAALKAGFKDVSITHVCPFPIYVPVSMATDKKIAAFNKFILYLRSIFQKYPYKTNRLVAQAHFLVGYK